MSGEVQSLYETLQSLSETFQRRYETLQSLVGTFQTLDHLRHQALLSLDVFPKTSDPRELHDLSCFEKVIHMMSFASLLIMVSLTTVPVPGGQTKFNYLKIKGTKAETTHSLKYKFKVDKSYKFLAKTNYQPTFGGIGFNVSLAAFAANDRFIMIHAETHTDGSGGLDYSKLRPDRLDGLNFTSKEQCAELDPVDINEEHDLRFLKENGFDPSPAVYIKQYFATSVDGTSEIVFTYGIRLANCKGEAVAPEFKQRIDIESKKAVKIQKKIS